MRLSVIIPTLNGRVRASIPEDPDLEVVVVRGLSPVGRARNEGLRRATGDYIAWVDADDEVTADWMASIRAALKDAPDAVVVDYVQVMGAREVTHVWQPSARGFLADVIGDRVLSALWCYVVRRDLWEGVRFDEKDPVAEDHRVIPEVMSRVRSVARAGCVYRYIVHGDSLIHTNGPARARVRFQAACERAARWAGTEYEGLAFAGAIRMAGWMDEVERGEGAFRAYLRQNWWRAMCCRELSLWWKFKATMLALGLGAALKPLYRLGA